MFVPKDQEFNQKQTILSKENQKLFGKTCNSIISIRKIECINGLSAFKRLALAERRISMLEPLEDKQKLKFLACCFFNELSFGFRLLNLQLKKVD